MTEEEAIEWLKALLQDKEKYEKYHSWVGTNTFVSIQTLLNLIEKQQKEIKRLDLENQAFYEEINCNDNDYISKKYCKLKQEIEELI